MPSVKLDQNGTTTTTPLATTPNNTKPSLTLTISKLFINIFLFHNLGLI